LSVRNLKRLLNFKYKSLERSSVRRFPDLSWQVTNPSCEVHSLGRLASMPSRCESMNHNFRNHLKRPEAELFLARETREEADDTGVSAS
jgi:hypothetical protein